MQVNVKCREQVKQLQAENERLKKVLEIARDRFVNPIFGCDWPDAADDIDKALKGK